MADGINKYRCHVRSVDESSNQPLLERAWELCRSTLGDDHPDTLESANSLVLPLRELAQYEQARQLGEDVLTRSRRVFGKDDPHTLFATSILTVSQ